MKISDQGHVDDVIPARILVIIDMKHAVQTITASVFGSKSFLRPIVKFDERSAEKVFRDCQTLQVLSLLQVLNVANVDLEYASEAPRG